MRNGLHDDHDPDKLSLTAGDTHILEKLMQPKPITIAEIDTALAKVNFANILYLLNEALLRHNILLLNMKLQQKLKFQKWQGRES